MSDAAEESRTALSWEIQLVTALPIPPAAAGALIATGLVATCVAGRLLTGDPMWFERPGGDISFTGSFRASILLSILIGYAFASGRWAGIASFRDLQAIGLEDPDVDLRRQERLAHRTAPEALTRSRLWGAAGVVAAVALALALESGQSGSIRGIARWSFGDWWLLMLTVLLFWVLGRGAFFAAGGSRYRPELAAARVTVQLLDLRPLRVFGRSALRSSLQWIVGIAIGSLLFLTPEMTEELAVALIALLGGTFAFALATLLLPLRGLQRRIRDAKRAELERIDRAIQGDAAALAGTLLGRRDPAPSVADLVAYRGLIADVREWPFDAGAPLRLAFYSLIPLGSWVAAAFVERGLGALLE